MTIAAARSDPRNNRAIFWYNLNGEEKVEVQECLGVGALTFEVNGDITEIICTNLATGNNDVVGVIDSGSTSKATFDLSRYLPPDVLSKFLELVKLNCGLRFYIARGSTCIDPFNPHEFDVLDAYGLINFGNYTRTDMIHMNKAEAAAILEGTTVTTTALNQLGRQSLAIRGSTTLAPIVGLTLCDKRSCGGKCKSDSDGCQKWLWVTATGDVGYTNNQFNDDLESQATGPTLTLTPELVTDIVCVKSQLVLSSKENTAGQGALHYTDLNTILSGGTPTWTTVTADSKGTLLENINHITLSADTNIVWLVGDNGSIYQYNPTNGLVVKIPGVSGLTTNFNFIKVNGDTILIGGASATLIRSQDGGRSFQQMVVIDPDTGLALVGVTLNTGSILSKENWAIGTSDDRVIYTLNDGVSYAKQIIANAGAGTITDLHFDSNLVGYMTRNVAGAGVLYKTYYGNSLPWLLMPESTDPLPTNGGLSRVLNCNSNPNVSIIVGETSGGAGFILKGTSKYI